ncbi:hypothetical protein ACIQU4_13595 [Streptomyces sp. NPDC090741]|uniref:hypothetical protein n=1 Tax=Streptomyces sp. NPDC090741 TaxID=3365967 RepID=UPI0037F700A8
MTVGLAFLGYLATYANGLRLAQRQARLARVNQQLSEFYGPLFALMETNRSPAARCGSTRGSGSPG